MRKTDRARPAVTAISAICIALSATQALAQAQTNTQTRFSGLKMSGNEPIQIESDKLEVFDKESKAIFSGNVSVVQGPTLLKAGKLTVYYVQGTGSATTGSAAIDHLEVDETVYVKSDDQVATGDKGTFDMKTEILVLTGKQVVLSQGPNVLTGCTLTVNMKTGQAQVDGCGGSRVKTLLKPNSANGTGTQSQ